MKKVLTLFLLVFIIDIGYTQSFYRLENIKFIEYKYSFIPDNKQYLNIKHIFLNGKDTIVVNLKVYVKTNKRPHYYDCGLWGLNECRFDRDSLYTFELEKICIDSLSNYLSINEFYYRYIEKESKDNSYRYKLKSEQEKSPKVKVIYNKDIDMNNEIYRILKIYPCNSITSKINL